MGGLSRRNTALQTLRESGPVVSVDVGGSLLKSGSLAGDAGPQNRVKAALIAQSVALGGVDAMTLSSSDWQLGAGTIFEWVKDHKLPVLAANLECDGRAPFPGFRVVEAGGKRVGFVGVTAGQIEGCVLKEPTAAAASALESMGPVDVRVLMLPFDARKASAYAGIPADLALYLGGGRSASFGDEGPLGFTMPPRGKTLGAVTVTWHPGASQWVKGGQLEELTRRRERLLRRMETLERRGKEVESPAEVDRFTRQADRNQKAIDVVDAEIKATEKKGNSAVNIATLSEINLDRTVENHTETEKRLRAVLNAIAEMELGAGPAQLLPRLAPPSSAFLGADACAGCHPGPSKQWLSTPHSKAMTTLVAENHHADRECIPCHVTGYGAPGGPESPAAVRGLRDVQCEACHGPGREHAKDPKAHPLAAVPNDSTCVFCHDGERDEGRFDRATYWPRIVHSAAER